MKSSKLLKMMGMGMTILGIISIIVTSILLIHAIITSQTETNKLIRGILTIIVSLAMVPVGIIGIKSCNKPEKSKICIIACFIYIAILIISHISYSVAVPSPPIKYALNSFDYIFPVLYLIAGFQLKKMGK